MPRSNQEVYDDDFELLWPESYANIGKKLGGIAVIRLAGQPGDLQFLCTDSKTRRSNRITHVAMVVDDKRIVHARGSAYGVCTNARDHYSGKVCAVSRYNPSCTLRAGMKGNRTLALQKALNLLGAGLEADGKYENATADAVKRYQEAHGLPATGQADAHTLKLLGLLETSVNPDGEQTAVTAECRIRITGETVNIRTGPGVVHPIAGIAKRGETYEPVDSDGWLAILLNGEIRWISKKYVQEQ